MTSGTLDYLLNLAINERDTEAARLARSDEQFSPRYGIAALAVKELLDLAQKGSQ